MLTTTRPHLVLAVQALAAPEVQLLAQTVAQVWQTPEAVAAVEVFPELQIPTKVLVRPLLTLMSLAMVVPVDRA
jgi:hypothetical protein